MEELLDHHAEAARERWFGAQAAASYLGLHRSTLFLAVQRKHLVPDHFTPGGHARFRQETLEAFRAHIASEAATSDAPLFAPVQTLAKLAHDVNGVAPMPKPTKLIHEQEISDEVKEVCESAVTAITSAPLRIPICCIALRVSDQHNPLALRTIAQRNLTRSLLRHYEWLRHQPNTSFATLEAMETLTPHYCENTAEDPIMRRNGSAQLIKEHSIGSYAVFPIVGGNVALGILLLISHEPRSFSAHEMTFLRGVADQVATAVTNQSRAARLRAYAEAGRELTRIALAFRARVASPDTSPIDTEAPTGPLPPANDLTALKANKRAALLRLMGVFLQGAEAESVCALGFEGGEVRSPYNELNLLTEQSLCCDESPSSAPEGERGGLSIREAGVAGDCYLTKNWSVQGATASALAISVPLDGRRRAAIGAMWRRPGEWSDEDHLLLVTLAGACAMISGA